MPTVITTTGQSDTTNNPTYQYFTQTFAISGNLTMATKYVYPGNATEQSNENIFYILPIACTLVKSYGNMGTAPGGADTCIVTVREDGADTTNTFTITGAAVTGSDITHTADFAAGGRVSVKEVSSAAVGKELSVTLLFRYALQ